MGNGKVGNNGQVIGAIKLAWRKLFKPNMLIVDDMIQACQWQKCRPTLGPCFCVLRLW
jgi:hypothetical protein